MASYSKASASEDLKSDLRAEFPHVDMVYVRTYYPDALTQAERYNAARCAVDPDQPTTHVVARRALQRLMRKVGS